MITHYKNNTTTEKMHDGGYMAKGGELDSKDEVKGLIATIFRSEYNSPTNVMYGKKDVLIVDKEVPEIFGETKDRKAVKLVRREIGDKEYIHAVPMDLKDKRGNVMFGGTFIYSSDSRFPSKYPIPLHDRVER